MAHFNASREFEMNQLRRRATSFGLFSITLMLGVLVAVTGAATLRLRLNAGSQSDSSPENSLPQSDWIPWSPPAIRPIPLDFPVLRRAVVDLHSDDIQPLVNRLEPPHPAPLSALLHAAQLYGLDTRIPVGATTLPILDVLTAETRYFNGQKIYIETPTGLRCLTQEPAYRHVQPERQTHPCQLLCEFAKQGIPRDHKIIANGATYSVADCVADLSANLALETDEPEWGCIALICYLPPTKSWTDKNQHVVTFDAIAGCLMRQPTGSRRVQGCFGIHRLEGLAMLARADETYSLLSSEMRTRVRSHLSSTVERLLSSQSADGSWDAWSHMPAESRPRSRQIEQNPETASEVAGRALVVSHHVHWMLMLAPKMQPANDTYRRAAHFLVNAVASATDNDILRYYCPYSHAAKVLVSLTAG